jgi:hypothetical protein
VRGAERRQANDAKAYQERHGEDPR